jgi:hypothetical protein
MNDELNFVWKEAVVAYSRYLPGICLKRVSKTARMSSVPAEI